jgi:hypothetical protein
LRCVEQLSAVASAQYAGASQRAAAAEAGVARSTLRHWEQRRAQVASPPPALAAFMQTPEGVQWLRRLVLAAHWCITELGSAGVRVVCEFLELSGLSAFVAASYGHRQAFNAQLEEAIVAGASEQRAALAAGMPARSITVAEDETWLGPMSLVAIEAVSNFILLEQFAEDRSAPTWSAALKQALVGLNVTVVQGTSDEAKGLLAHVQRDLGAHHSPDLFHLQHEVAKGTGLALARAVKQTEAHEAAAEVAWQEARAAEQVYHRQRHGPGRPPAFAQRIDEALSALVQAQVVREQAQSRLPQYSQTCVRAVGPTFSTAAAAGLWGRIRWGTTERWSLRPERECQRWTDNADLC